MICNPLHGHIRRYTCNMLHGICSIETKVRVYLSLVHPILEYASTVWDPYTNKDSDQIVRVQRSAARWVCGSYDWRTSVSLLLEALMWPTLKFRRKTARLIGFYKSIYNLIPLKIPSYYNITSRPTRSYHGMHYILHPSSTDSYRFSFIPNTICDWNNLPIWIIESNSLESFVAYLNQYI